MNIGEKDKRKEFPPSNVSSRYYSDPVYSSDAFYGFENGEIQQLSESTKESKQNEEALDEPVESWGWINNVDNRQF